MNRYFSYPNVTHWGDPTRPGRDFESGCVALAKDPMWVGGNYDLQRMIHSLTGKGMMDGADLEKRFQDIADPELRRFWASVGLAYDVHEKNGRPWLSFVPQGALESGERLPVILVFRPACVFAQSFYYHLNMMAAQGEMILLYFSTESVEENELFTDILEEAGALYPIDHSRVYATGHSHYGEFVCEFVSRHPKLVAAIAQQCDSPGVSSAFGSDELTERFHAMDMPTIIISGNAEMCQVFPVSGDAPAPVAENWRFIYPQDRVGRMEAWRRRLYAMNCPDRTPEELAAAGTGTLAERMLGFPADHSETLHADGLDYYIGDIRNSAGKDHFRVVCIENFPHTTCAFMHTLSWSFLRRFARDPASGVLAELYT